MQITAPAKIILFGEHAVVYGQPAIAVPVTTLRARVSLKPSAQGNGTRIIAPDSNVEFQILLDGSPPPNSLAYAAQLALKHLDITTPPDLDIILHSDIPMGRGLGSGASVSTAVVRALTEYYKSPLAKTDLNAMIYEVETRNHGTPSGIDNTVVVYEQPVYFVREKPIERIKIYAPFTLLIADSGYGTPTHVPVGDVRRLNESKPDYAAPIFERIGAIANEARHAMEQGDTAQIGRLMNENHDLLQRLTVSSIELDVLCESALEAGARGAKMSGGGRGGNIIALVRDEHAPTVTRALHSAGAVRVVKTRIRP